MGCYSTQSKLARHDRVQHMFNNSLYFLSIPACSARHATRDANITFPLTSSWKHNINKEKKIIAELNARADRTP